MRDNLGYDLPPGVSDRDIEGAQGNDENYCPRCGNELSDMEKLDASDRNGECEKCFNKHQSE